jgi:hypothetical protein
MIGFNDGEGDTADEDRRAGLAAARMWSLVIAVKDMRPLRDAATACNADKQVLTS